MVDLTVNYGKGLTPLKEIAARQQISEKYLEQIVILLGRSGLVKSVRGAHGGYTLASPPSEITVGMILRVLEGSLGPVDNVDIELEGGESAYLEVVLGVWKQISQAIENVVNSITLEMLGKQYAAISSLE